MGRKLSSEKKNKKKNKVFNFLDKKQVFKKSF